MSKYTAAGTAAEIISKEHKIHISDLVDTFAKIPAADVVEVVRCKDCIYNNVMDMGGMFICRKTNAYMFDTDYCSYGKKRRGDGK